MYSPSLTTACHSIAGLCPSSLVLLAACAEGAGRTQSRHLPAQGTLLLPTVNKETGNNTSVIASWYIFLDDAKAYHQHFENKNEASSWVGHGVSGVYTVFLAGASPNIRSYTVYIYGSGQPYK
jgi:hypothetical protein